MTKKFSGGWHRRAISFLVPAGIAITSLVAVALLAGAPLKPHILSTAQPLLEAEDGVLLGNGDLSVSIYQSRDRILFRFGKSDVWDRRIDRSDDPKPPHIKEIANGIANEGWKALPYGGAPPVALKGTSNPGRMNELLSGTPASYAKRPYPCPKPVGELAIQLPPDLPGLQVLQELTIEEAVLRVNCTSQNGVEIRLTCFVPPSTNILVVKWEVRNWTETTLFGTTPPLKFAVYRWADPPILQFAQQFLAESGHDAFMGMDHTKSAPLAPPTVSNVSDRPAIEQTFPPDPTFPRGFRYAMVPFASEGTWRALDLGSVKEARLISVPAPTSNSGWVAVAVPTTAGDGGLEAELAKVTAPLARNPEETLQIWERHNHEDASRFWSQSSVEIGDPLLENLWYETFHARRCTTKVGKPPPGLFLPSTVRDYSHWHGDYHTNYNLQQPFWADFTANHIELGDAYFSAMSYFMQMGKIIAEKYYGTRGVFIQLTGYPIVATDDVLGAVPMGRMAYMTGWVTTLYWERYLKTKDDKWLNDVGYPAIRDCALFYLDFMQEQLDGLYHIFPSNQGEDGFTGDVKDFTDRAQVMRYARYALRVAIHASEVLSCDAQLREQWHDRLDHAAGDDGHPPLTPTNSDNHPFERNPPEFLEGSPGSTNWVADSSSAPWPAANHSLNTWYPGQYPWAAIWNLRKGTMQPERIYRGLRNIIERWRHPNGLVWAMAIGNYGHSGAWTEMLGITAPLQEMMLQSFGGVLRIFPCWPKALNGRFRTFRAEGAFLVSASWSDGSVASVEVRSEKGGVCRLCSPWSCRPRVVTSEGQEIPVSGPADNIYSFETEAGRAYVLTSP